MIETGILVAVFLVLSILQYLDDKIDLVPFILISGMVLFLHGFALLMMHIETHQEILDFQRENIGPREKWVTKKEANQWLSTMQYYNTNLWGVYIPDNVNNLEPYKINE